MTDEKFAYLGILSILTAFLTIGITVSLHPWFSWSNNALSDLGATGTDHAAVYNWGMILAGGLGMVFGFGLVDYFESRISRGGSLIFISGTFLLVLVGWFESGTDPHVTVSLLFFAVTTIGVLVVGIGETEGGEKFGFITLIIILLGAVSAFWASRVYSGAAIPEIIGAVVFGIFALIYSYKILSTAE